MTKRIVATVVAVALQASTCDGFSVPQQQHALTTRNRNSVGPLHSVLVVDDAAAAVSTFYQSEPYLAAFLTCSLKASAADSVAQKSAASYSNDDESNSFDVSRNLAFLCYGGIWQGMFQQMVFTLLYPAIFPGNSLLSVMAKVLFDTTIMGPCVCLPVCYTVKSWFQQSSSESDGNWTWTTGIESYVKDVQEKGVLSVFWSIWVPAQMLTFSVVPTHFRVAFVALISFFWVCALSMISSSSSSEENQVGSNTAPQPASWSLDKLLRPDTP